MKKMYLSFLALMVMVVMATSMSGQSGLKNYVWQHNGNRPVYTAPNFNGVPLNLTAPTDKQVFMYDATSKTYLLQTFPRPLMTSVTASACAGSVALVAGTKTVNTTCLATGDLIFLTNNLVGGTVGTLSVGTRVVGTSFVINSSSGTDTSTVAWHVNHVN